MFHSYRKFNQSSKKGIYLLVVILIAILTIGIIAYKGVGVNPKLIVNEINIINR